MAAIHFYHLTSTPLERALPKLLEKSYAGGFRTVVLAEEARVERLNELLWTYDQDSFLPHGSARGGNAELQPILLTAALPTEVGAKEILFITNGVLAENPAPYDRVIDMFDGGNDASLTSARARWKHYKDSGCELCYYQQTSSGNWDKKAA